MPEDFTMKEALAEVAGLRSDLAAGLPADVAEFLLKRINEQCGELRFSVEDLMKDSGD